MLRIGPKARIQGLRSELNLANIVLLGILLKHNAVMILSHGIDGVHARASIHYMGGAEDLVFAQTLEPHIKQQIYEEWKQGVGQDFDILFESIGTPNEHFHCEWQPKEAYK